MNLQEECQWRKLLIEYHWIRKSPFRQRKTVWTDFFLCVGVRKEISGECCTCPAWQAGHVIFFIRLHNFDYTVSCRKNMSQRRQCTKPWRVGEMIIPLLNLWVGGFYGSEAVWKAGSIAHMSVSIHLCNNIVTILNIGASTSVFNIRTNDGTVFAGDADELLIVDAASCDNISPKLKTIFHSFV